MNPALLEILLDVGDPIVPPIPPVPSDYWPKLDFTDARNSMYSCGGF